MVPSEWGPKFEQDGFVILHGHAPPGSLRFTAPMHFALILLSAQPGRQVSLNSDRKQVGLAPAGSLELVPRGSDLYAHWPTAKQHLLIAFTDERLKQLAGEEFDSDTFALNSLSLGSIDREAMNFARRMKHEISHPKQAHADCLSALATLFGAYLLRNHSTLRSQSAQRHQGGLSPATWRRVHDFIRGNLSEKLTLSEMAKEARLSPSYFSRAFLKTTGQSPHQFVLALRLAQARCLITETDKPLEAIAQATGFSRHSHMTGLMKRKWHTTPSELRQNHSRITMPPKGEDDAQG